MNSFILIYKNSSITCKELKQNGFIKIHAKDRIFKEREERNSEIFGFLFQLKLRSSIFHHISAVV